MKLVIVTLLLMFSVVATPVSAQFGSGSDFVDPFSSLQNGVDGLEQTGPTITLDPDFPQPGEEFTVTYTDYTEGGFGSSVSWLVDGEEVMGSANQNKIELVAGEAGISQTISVLLRRPNGEVVRADYALTPLYLDVIFEPQTHVPDFYLGRSLPSVGSLVNATVILSGENTNPSNLIYTWRVGGGTIEGGPIRGGDSVTFEAPSDATVFVGVSVSRLDGTEIASRLFILPIVEPYLRFYESNPLLGLSMRPAEDPYTIVGNSVTLRATPFHLDSRVFNSPSVLEWKVGSQAFPSGNSNPYEITLESTGNVGRSSVQFHVRSTDNLLQGARDSIDIRL